MLAMVSNRGSIGNRGDIGSCRQLARNHITQPLKYILLIASKLGSNGSRIISQLTVNVISIRLHQISCLVLSHGIQDSSRSIGHLVALSLDLRAASAAAAGRAAAE